MSEITDVLQKITNEIKADSSAIKTMAVSTAEDFVSKIKPEVFVAVGDAVTAAETAYEADPGVDKYAVAFAAAIASLEKDGVTFAESEINYAIETFVQARNAALATAAAPTPSEVSADPAAAPTA